ncbi:hypothetical protein [Mesorhizobium sp.]|uniref:hypothetical protein n=1 Tax=Mesorhizobium sp. TaxID=1871066 RepID=UPI00257FF414|nr:hypothetical protein [Mesorhizobium sp.]
MSAFGGPFGGFLWIGSGKLAVISLVAISAASIALCYMGFPVLPGIDLSGLASLSSIGIALFSVVLVVPFAHRFKPDKWYARVSGCVCDPVVPVSAILNTGQQHGANA